MSEAAAAKLPLTVAVPVSLNRISYINRFFTIGALSELNRYVRALKKEIASVAPDFEDTEIDRIEIQAGAPSLIEQCPDMDRLLEQIRKSFHVSEDAELWYQFDPELKGNIRHGLHLHFPADSVIELRLVSVVPEERKAIEFPFDEEDVKVTVEELREKMPGQRLSVLVLYGLPGQTKESFDKSLRFALETGFDRIRILPYDQKDRYVMSMLYKPNQRKFLATLPVASPELLSELRKTGEKICREAGMEERGKGVFVRQEVKGLEERENLLGLGIGAFTRMDGNGYWNTEDVDKYMKNADRFDVIAEDFFTAEN